MKIKSNYILLITLISVFSVGCSSSKKTSPEEYQPKGLAVGTTIENFTAIDSKSVEYSLDKALESGRLVLIFIRGQWCPVCNKHMSLMQDSLQYIYEKGASLVVISPDKPEFIEKTIEKTGAEFTILYDESQKISDYFDVTFHPDGKTKLIYNSVLGAKLKEAHTDDSERLPVPATFIINKDKKIIWRQFDIDYKNRSTVSEIIHHLPTNQ